MNQQKDAVIVGARCAGATLAIQLARLGWDVLMVDRLERSEHIVSTHLIYPNALAQFERLGVLERLYAENEIPSLEHRLVSMGCHIEGGFSSIASFTHAIAPRRSVLDKAILDTALSSGVEVRLDEFVVALLGSGTADDPIRGVVLENGDEVSATWVFGADGRSSMVAAALGLQREQELRGEMSFLFAYWRGLANDGYATSDIHDGEAVFRWAVDDDLHLLVAAGDREYSRGSKAERHSKYLQTLNRFRATAGNVLDGRAVMASGLLVAPESLMRGFFRTPTGPGWALVGDSSHVKHPATGQGIADAVEDAIFVGETITREGNLDCYQDWRDSRAREFYEWSFYWARFPSPELKPLFVGLMNDRGAAQKLRDSLSRRVLPRDVFTLPRLQEWFGSNAAAERAMREALSMQP